ncbi:glycosyltransferase [Azonexus sp. IMCC34842]|uniref:glycosyltransferase n=1 Tax=Azonexus sp. IMCC34842 TaxID=3420950 RepID=UPI003D0E6865
MTSQPENRDLSLFDSERAPYYIYAYDYRHSSAGIRNLHYLCHALNELGYEAYIANATVTSEYLRTPLLDESIVRRHFLAGRTPIALYPEVVAGNPLNAPVVARWLLNVPGNLGNENTLNADNPIFYHLPWCLPAGVVGHQLYIPSTDTRIFHNNDNPDDAKRSGFCRYANKYLASGRKIRPEHLAYKSLGHEVSLTPEEIAAIFRQSEALYCYERSAIIEEAMACGCPVLLIDSDYWRVLPIEVTEPGVTVDSGPESLARVKTEIGDQPARLVHRQQMAWDEIRNFVRQTQSRAPELLHKNHESLWQIAKEQRPLHINHLMRELANAPGYSLARKGMAERETARDPDDFALSAAELQILNRRSLERNDNPAFHLIVLDVSGTPALIASTLRALGSLVYEKLLITVVSPLGQSEIACPVSRATQWLQSVQHPALAINGVIGESPADWCGVIQSGNEIVPHALLAVCEYLHTHQTISALCTDEDLITKRGTLTGPQYAPTDDLDIALATGKTRGLLLARQTVWMAAGGWRRTGYQLEELDARLRLHETAGENAFGHVPGILLHRHQNNCPPLDRDPHHVTETHKLIVKGHLLRSNIAAEIEPGQMPHLCNIRHALPNPPKITAIILTKDNGAGLSACLRSLHDKTDYPNLAILVIDNGTTEKSARAVIDNLIASAPASIQVASFNQPFNLATMCNAAAQVATGELLLFLHDDVEALHPDWLKTLAAQCRRPGVAMAGGCLLTADGKIQEAGIVPLQVGIVGNSFAGLAQSSQDPLGLLHTAHPVAAISAACMLVRRDIFEALGGMDAANFPSRVADIDFCLKVRAAGYQIMWTPYATLQHDSDGTTQGNRHDNDALLAKWGSRLTDDPCFNPHLTINSNQFEPETDPTFLPDPVTWHPLPNIFAVLTDGNWTAKGRLEQTIESATELGHIRGRVAKSFPAPVQIKRLAIDTVLCAAPLTPRQLREVARYRQLLGCRIVMDIDQLFLLEFEPADPLRHIRTCLHHFDRDVDQFTCSSAWLVNQLPKWRERIQLVPETLDGRRWSSLSGKPIRRSEKMRIGWHVTPADRQVIAPTIIELADEVDWILLGEVPAELIPYATERHQAVAYDDFPAKLAGLDLDLAVLPLAVTAKNQCRSHLAILEYGHLGIPVIASDTAGHQTGLPIALVENTDRNWCAAIRNHLSDREASKQQGEVLKQHVHSHWMFEQHLDGWLRTWTKA